MKKEIENKLIDCIGIENVKLEEPMEKHTTFRIGGPADYFLCPQTAEELKAVIHVCKETGTPYFILGNGSNLLVSDKGYRGAVIQIWKNMSEVSVEDETKIRAQAGAQLSKIASCALEQSLEGFEFAAGIPGTLGGAVVMNAGAYGTDVEDMDTCLKLTYKELKRMRDTKMTSSQLAAAKKQLIGQIGVASDNFENNALGMAKTYLHYHKYESSELVFKRIEALTAEQLLEVSNEMFAEEYLSTLIYK